MVIVQAKRNWPACAEIFSLVFKNEVIGLYDGMLCKCDLNLNVIQYLKNRRIRCLPLNEK